MRITRIEAIATSVPFKKPFAIAGGTEPFMKHVITKVHTDEDIVGLGETAPLPSYSDETQEGTKTAIEKYLSPVVVGQDPFHLEEIVNRMDGVLRGHNFAKAAIDIAIWDILGKYLRRPVYSLLGGCSNPKISVVGDIGIGEEEVMVEEAARYAKNGHEVIKIKIGRDPVHDYETIRAIREAIGEKPKIIVDVNQGYTFDVARKILPRMEEFDLQLIEQPVPRQDLDAMARLSMMLRTPICADESVFTPRDAIEVIKKGAADVINIKIIKPGGLYNSRKVLTVAEAAGIPCLTGSNFENEIGTAASIHFNATFSNMKYASHLVGTMLASDRLTREPLLPEKGFFEVPQKPGLGVELDDGKIERYSVEV